MECLDQSCSFRFPTVTRGRRVPYSRAVSAEHTPDRLALGAFVGAVVIGGSNFVGVRISNRELDPLWGAGLRFGLATIVFTFSPPR